MNKIHVVSLVFLIVGIIFFIMGAMQGNVQGGVFLIFPFVIGSGLYAFLGILCIMLSFLLFIVGFTPRKTIPYEVPSQEKTLEQKPTIKGGGIVLVGPIPVVVGSSWKIAVALILAAIFLSVLIYFLFYYG